jgi:hypothetical protein
MKKKLLLVVVVVLLLVFFALTAVILTLDSSIETAVEEGGTHALKVPVQLEDVNTSLTDGRASLKGFSVANPEGFSTPHAISLEEVSAEIKLSTLGSEVIEVPVLVLKKPKVTIETKMLGIKGSNIKTLLDNLDATLAEYSKATSAPGEEPAEEDAPAGKPQRYRVGKIRITGATLGLADDKLTGGKEQTVTIDEIEVPAVSSDMTMADIIKVSLKAMVGAAAKQSGPVGDFTRKLTAVDASKVVDDVKKVGKDALDGVKKVGKDALDKVRGTGKDSGGKSPGEVVKDVTKGVGDVGKDAGRKINEIGKGLGDLFKKKKPAEEEEKKESEKK